MKTTILTSVMCVALAFSVNAQKPLPFTAKTANPAKIKAAFDFPTEGRNSKNGGGYSSNMELVNPKPKKVALVSFYLYDPACSKAKGGTYTGSVSVSCWRTSDSKGQEHIDGFYAKSIDAMKEEFKKYDIELLTPEEFIDTDEKADFYYNFSQESAKKEKSSVTIRKAAGTTISSVAEASVSTLKISPTGKGYRAFFVANEDMTISKLENFKSAGIMGANRKMSSSLGYELCKGLGVDAVVVCYIVTRKPNMKKEDYAVNAVSLYMFGPNPIIDGEDDKNRGQFYCGTRFFTKPLLFESKKIGTVSYDNMDNVIRALSGRMCNWVINKAKK
ncbi:MAG: hypothetical protein CVU05_05440 [Bacteroidetes bacterium HGW-Bacteroidetes-21]|jgi:hypothetical protein|nr:MAG: hypothetical protein CVU05_05440 [Bacteroidetes bacterium HGW-Bacteroidetes-21]